MPVRKNAYVALDNVSIVAGNTSGIKSYSDNCAGEIYGSSSGIVVNGIEGKVSFYTATGSLVKSAYVDGSSSVFDLPQGVYLVQVNGNKVYRVIR